MRLDVYLAEHALSKSRSRAREQIENGYVTVGGVVVTKPSYDVADGEEVKVTGDDHPFVGRGGMKLEGALTAFGVSPAGRICADIGASTGGFTDCMLRHGAAKVCAVDSGHGQLDETLASDERVVNLEGMNARSMTAEDIGGLCGFAAADLSFISLTLVLPAICGILEDGGEFIGLIKPQFECGRSALNKNGIVRDAKQHKAAIRRVLSAAAECGLAPRKIMKSPISGGDGNTEFLFLASKGGASSVAECDIEAAVKG